MATHSTAPHQGEPRSDALERARYRSRRSAVKAAERRIRRRHVVLEGPSSTNPIDGLDRTSELIEKVVLRKDFTNTGAASGTEIVFNIDPTTGAIRAFLP